MILAVTFTFGALATYWAITTARVRGGSPPSSIVEILIAMAVSTLLSGIVYAMGGVWAVLADLASSSNGNTQFDVLRAWVALVGPIVAFVVVPAAYAAANALQQNGFRLGDRWRIYGFPSIVAAIYLTLNVISFVTDEIWRWWSQLSLWSYVLVPVHCVAVYASWIVYVAGNDRLVTRPLTSKCSTAYPRRIPRYGGE
jgi:hypothetical protein